MSFEGLSAFGRRPLDATGILLAADAREGRTTYAHDVIWRLRAQPGFKGGLIFETQAGLRVQSWRLYPRFHLPQQAPLQAPDHFAQGPVLYRYTPNYAALVYEPLPGLRVQAEYYIFASHGAMGRLAFVNLGPHTVRLTFAWVADLLPLEPDDQPFAPQRRGGLVFLQARLGSYVPVLFLTGGPEGVDASPPALSLPIALAGGQSRRLVWTLVLTQDEEESLRQARRWAAQPWDAIRARLELWDARTVHVAFPDNPSRSWLALRGRNTALRLLMGPTSALPRPFLVRRRNPEHGYSPSGTGRDYGVDWSGLTPSEAWYAAVAYWLTSSPETVAGWVENYLTTADEATGFIDGRPGLGGQRGRFLASPLLVDLAWRAYQATEDRTFARRVYGPLARFLARWLEPEEDADQDGWPEWRHGLQMGLPPFPLSAGWLPGSPGVDLRVVENPALLAFLDRAYHRLTQLAQVAGVAPPPAVEARRAAWREALQEMWSPQRGYALNRDRDAHISPPGRVIARGRGSDRLDLDLTFPVALRVVVQLESTSTIPRAARVTVTGRDHRGRMAKWVLEGQQWRWYGEHGFGTGPVPMRELHRVVIEDVDRGVRWRVVAPDWSWGDITLLAPLWAEMLTPEQARTMVQRAILPAQRFGHPWGLPVLAGQRSDAPEAWRGVWPFWNALVVEGLMAYGFWDEAVALLQRWLDAQTRLLDEHGWLYEVYHADTGQPLDGPEGLYGVPPLGLVLRAAGVQVAPRRITLTGPFRWAEPLTVRLAGWTLTRSADGVQVYGPGEAHLRLPAEALGYAQWLRGTWQWVPASPPDAA
ncbi:MAG: hypothetical protein GXO54_06880 [Chloroflexi bacterium]|nr:hypothetical protein [Chloroflexota bacterium]